MMAETYNRPSRQVILNYNRAKSGSLKLAKVQTENQQRRVREIRRGTIGDHTIHMPQRQMIGPSPVLERRCETVIIKLLIPALKAS